MEPNTDSKNNLKYAYVGVLLLFLLVLVILNVIKQNKAKQAITESAPVVSIQKETVTPTVNLVKSFFSLRIANNLTSFSQNDNIILKIVADSDNKEIVGYDVLVAYDTSAFDLVSVSSLLPSFRVYKFAKENHLSLTGTKVIGTTTSAIFKDTALAEVVLKPKKTGNFTFTLKPTINQEKTQMVDNQTKIIYPRLNEVALKVN